MVVEIVVSIAITKQQKLTRGGKINWKRNRQCLQHHNNNIKQEVNKHIKSNCYWSSIANFCTSQLQCQSHAGSPNDRVPFFWCETFWWGKQPGMNEEELSGGIWMDSADKKFLERCPLRHFFWKRRSRKMVTNKSIIYGIKLYNWIVHRDEITIPHSIKIKLPHPQIHI